MSKRDISEKVYKMVMELGEAVLQDQRVATDASLVKKTYDALHPLVDLHNDLDPVQQLTWPHEDSGK